MDIDRIPYDAISLRFFETGSFDVRVDRHVHCKTCPYTILAQAVQGRYEIHCGPNRHESLAEGEAFLVPAFQPLRIVHHGDPREGGRMRARWLHIHVTLFDAVDLLSLLDMPLRVSAEQCEPFADIMSALTRVQECPPFVQLARKQELAFRTLAMLCELAPLRTDADDLWLRRHRLQPVFNHMREHLAERLTVTRLARLAHLSVPHFHALFRKYLGRSPMQHLKQLRLERAARLLTGSDASLADIAEATGFCNEFHLSREFRRVFGRPPRRWRADPDRTLP
ncbi:MAG: helix-turn-helix domain-containing protein [Phycisphaerae bacterium]|nr:helix-turn-helix domain-containing protein [Phycisphaerae bacterium]